MYFKNGVINIHAADYNGAHMVFMNRNKNKTQLKKQSIQILCRKYFIDNPTKPA